MFLDEKDDGYVKLKFKSKKDNEEEENNIEKKKKKKKITEKQINEKEIMKMEKSHPMLPIFGKDYLRYLHNN